jgi:hypothetical protein
MWNSEALFSTDPAARLDAARSLSRADVEELQNCCALDTPMKPWPYGMPTVINPYLVFMGPSPGRAPLPGDPIPQGMPYPAPTAGVPHGMIYYPGRYFDKIRKAAEIIIRSRRPALTEADCHALLGNVNLSTVNSGQARRVSTDPAYGQWIPRLITNSLRPRVLVAIGLRGVFSKASNLAVFDPDRLLKIAWGRPEISVPFRSYFRKKLRFQIWHRSSVTGSPITVVSWPNHPSQAPFSNDEMWQASAREFTELLQDEL